MNILTQGLGTTDRTAFVTFGFGSGVSVLEFVYVPHNISIFVPEIDADVLIEKHQSSIDDLLLKVIPESVKDYKVNYAIPIIKGNVGSEKHRSKIDIFKHKIISSVEKFLAREEVQEFIVKSQGSQIKILLETDSVKAGISKKEQKVKLKTEQGKARIDSKKIKVKTK